MLDKTGKITDVAIGVGGFLGMGERDVAVKFDQLTWSNEPVKSTDSKAGHHDRIGTCRRQTATATILIMQC
jgi:hypothetical protein